MEESGTGTRRGRCETTNFPVRATVKVAPTQRFGGTSVGATLAVAHRGPPNCLESRTEEADPPEAIRPTSLWITEIPQRDRPLFPVLTG